MPSDINGVDYCNANATFYGTAKCKLLFRRHDFGFYSLSDGKWRENFSLRNKTLSGLTWCDAKVRMLSGVSIGMCNHRPRKENSEAFSITVKAPYEKAPFRQIYFWDDICGDKNGFSSGRLAGLFLATLKFNVLSLWLGPSSQSTGRCCRQSFAGNATVQSPRSPRGLQQRETFVRTRARIAFCRGICELES